MPNPASVHVVFDSNQIWTGSAYQFLPKPVSSLIRTLSFRQSSDVHWYIPEVVRLEREYQMMSAAEELLPSISKLERLTGASFGVTREVLRARINSIIAKAIEDHRIEVPSFDSDAVNWHEIVSRAVTRLPPFEAGETEKGFRDAIIGETFYQLRNRLGLSLPAQLVLVSSDRLLISAVKDKFGSRPEIGLYKNIQELETNLVALSEKLDQRDAQELVTFARTFLEQNITVGRLTSIIFDSYRTELQASSTEGGIVTRWHVFLGDTALVGKEGSHLQFHTTIFVQADASRTIQVSPYISNTMSNIASNSTVTTFVAAPSNQGTVTQYPGTVTTVVPASEGTNITSTISSYPIAAGNGNSNISVFSSELTRIINTIGRHRLTLSWSAQLTKDRGLTGFEFGSIDYEDVTWE